MACDTKRRQLFQSLAARLADAGSPLADDPEVAVGALTDVFDITVVQQRKRLLTKPEDRAQMLQLYATAHALGVDVPTHSPVMSVPPGAAMGYLVAFSVVQAAQRGEPLPELFQHCRARRLGLPSPITEVPSIRRPTGPTSVPAGLSEQQAHMIFSASRGAGVQYLPLYERLADGSLDVGRMGARKRETRIPTSEYKLITKGMARAAAVLKHVSMPDDIREAAARFHAWYYQQGKDSQTLDSEVQAFARAFLVYRECFDSL